VAGSQGNVGFACKLQLQLTGGTATAARAVVAVPQLLVVVVVFVALVEVAVTAAQLSAVS
jgi:hypothetical protein